MSTAKRDISLARLDESYKNSIAYQYGLFAEKFSYDMLPEKVVHFAKTILLDSIGVMIGALDCDGFPRLTNHRNLGRHQRSYHSWNRHENFRWQCCPGQHLSGTCAGLQ